MCFGFVQQRHFFDCRMFANLHSHDARRLLTKFSLLGLSTLFLGNGQVCLHPPH
jgi:hypothetical protein